MIEFTEEIKSFEDFVLLFLKSSFYVISSWFHLKQITVATSKSLLGEYFYFFSTLSKDVGSFSVLLEKHLLSTLLIEKGD
jgi:hypothetical protein